MFVAGRRIISRAISIARALFFGPEFLSPSWPYSLPIGPLVGVESFAFAVSSPVAGADQPKNLLASVSDLGFK